MINVYFNSLVLAGILIVAHFLLVILMMRKVIRNKFSPLVIHFTSGIAMLVLLYCSSKYILNFDPWLVFTLFVFSSGSFFFLFGVVYKSLSLRFLLLSSLNDKKLLLSELNALVTKNSFTERTQILIDMGLALKVEKGFMISPKGKLIAERILRIRHIFGIKTTGLY